MQTYAFQVYVTDETGCLPSELQKHPDGRRWKCLPLRVSHCSLMPASLCPSHVAFQTYAFRIHATDQTGCKARELQKHPGCKNINFTGDPKRALQDIHTLLSAVWKPSGAASLWHSYGWLTK